MLQKKRLFYLTCFLECIKKNIQAAQTNQPDEEQLFYCGGRHHSQGGEAEEELAEPVGLPRVAVAGVFLQVGLYLLLKFLHLMGVCHSLCVC